MGDLYDKICHQRALFPLVIVWKKTDEEERRQKGILEHQLEKDWQKSRWETMVMPGKGSGIGRK